MNKIKQFVCASCCKTKDVDWDKWSEEVLVLDVYPYTDNRSIFTIRVCKECQEQNLSFKKNVARYIADVAKEHFAEVDDGK